MIYDLKTLSYNGKDVFQKVILDSPEREIRPFKANEACFMFVENGQFSVRTPEALVPIYQGNAVLAKCHNFFIESSLTQRTEGGKLKVIAVYLFADIIEELLDIDLSASSYTVKYNLKQIPMDKLFDNFRDGLELLFENPDVADESLIKTKLKEFFLLLSKTQGVSESDFLAGLFKLNTTDFWTTVTNNMYSSLTIDEFAKLCEMSKSAFKRKFVEVFKETPAKYLLKMKLKKSSELLLTSGMRSSEIAYECGFETTSTFNRTFRNQYSKSPTEYRLGTFES
jgi:AraC-like DNA-binding protein